MTLRQRAEAVVNEYEQTYSERLLDRSFLIGLVEQCLIEAIAAHDSICIGIEQSALGQSQYLGSFAEFADLDVDKK